MKIDSLEGELMNAFTASFNRAIRALEDSGAIDTRKMRKAYRGVGSEFYDLVTKQFEYTIRYATPSIREEVLREHNKSDGSN